MATQLRIRRRGRRRMLLLAAAVGAMSLVPGAVAFAQTDPYSGEEPEVLPTQIVNEEPREEEPVKDEVLPARIQAPAEDRQPTGTGVLPFTGADLTLFLVTGAAAVGTGSMMVKRARS